MLAILAIWSRRDGPPFDRDTTRGITVRRLESSGDRITVRRLESSGDPCALSSLLASSPQQPPATVAVSGQSDAGAAAPLQTLRVLLTASSSAVKACAPSYAVAAIPGDAGDRLQDHLPTLTAEHCGGTAPVLVADGTSHKPVPRDFDRVCDAIRIFVRVVHIVLGRYR